MDKYSLTVAIIVKNAESTIPQALESASWAEEIIVLDDHSTDRTVEISKKLTDKIYSTNQPNFSAKREELLKKMTTDWILYLDSDEVISKELRQEVIKIITVNKPSAYKVKRQNFFLGTKMYPDSVDRLFHRSVVKGWTGQLHDSPIVETEVNQLKHSLIHHTHTDITSMLAKTNKWSEFESDLRIKANHPPMAWWRLIRIAVTVFWQQYIRLGVGRFGRAGLFEGYFQIIDKLIVYTKVWEKQQK